MATLILSLLIRALIFTFSFTLLVFPVIPISAGLLIALCLALWAGSSAIATDTAFPQLIVATDKLEWSQFQALFPAWGIVVREVGIGLLLGFWAGAICLVAVLLGRWLSGTIARTLQITSVGSRQRFRHIDLLVILVALLAFLHGNGAERIFEVFASWQIRIPAGVTQEVTAASPPTGALPTLSTLRATVSSIATQSFQAAFLLALPFVAISLMVHLGIVVGQRYVGSGSLQRFVLSSHLPLAMLIISVSMYAFADRIVDVVRTAMNDSEQVLNRNQ